MFYKDIDVLNVNLFTFSLVDSDLDKSLLKKESYNYLPVFILLLNEYLKK